jgi:predicted  nucleic acid-binding Zn-ribbon protein
MPPEDSSTSTKKPSVNAFIDFFSKNAFNIIQSIVLVIVLLTNVKNDVSNVNVSLKSLTAQVEKMQESIVRFETYQSKVSGLEQRMDRIELQVDSLRDTLAAIESIYGAAGAKTTAQIETLNRDIARLDNTNRSRN